MPHLPNKHPHLHLWKLTESLEELQDLSQGKWDGDIERFGGNQRKKEWIATRLLLQQIIPHAQISYDTFGKPALRDKPYEIGISHTKLYIALQIHPYQSCGIDIEIIHERIHHIKTRFLIEKEIQLLSYFPSATIGLISFWCAKEALYKWYGKKELEFKEHLQLLEIEIQETATLKGSINALVVKGNLRQALEVNFEEMDGHILAFVKEKSVKKE